MERQRYIQWSVTTDDAGLIPLHYQVVTSEDRYGSKVLATENSEDRPDLFLKNGQPWSEPHVAEEGDVISYQISSSIPLCLPIVAQNSVIYRVASSGNHVLESLDIKRRIRYLSLDSKSNNVWVTDDQGMVFVIPVPWTGQEIRSVLTPLDTKSVVVDGARNRYWLIRKNSVDLISLTDGKLISTDSPYSIERVLSAQIPQSGSLFFACSSESSPWSFVMKIEEDGDYDSQDIGLIDLSTWGFDSVLGVSGGGSIYLYNGIDTPSEIITGGNAFCSITAKKGYGIYVASSLGGIWKYDSSYSFLGNLISSNGYVQLRAVFQSGDSSGIGRRLYCWSDNEVKAIEDDGSSGRIVSSVNWDNHASGIPTQGVLSSSFPTKHVWTFILSATSVTKLKTDQLSESSQTSVLTESEAESAPFLRTESYSTRSTESS